MSRYAVIAVAAAILLAAAPALLAVHIDGTGRADVLRGTPAADALHGRGGDDILIGGEGADRLAGGNGRDRLLGGPGDDRLDGGPAVDAFRAGTGDDLVMARDGRRETVRCGPGEDRVAADVSDRVVRNCETVVLPWRRPTGSERAGIVATLSPAFGDARSCFSRDEYRVAVSDPRYALWSAFEEALAYRSANGCLVGNGFIILRRGSDGSWARLVDWAWDGSAPCGVIGRRIAIALSGNPCRP